MYPILLCLASIQPRTTPPKTCKFCKLKNVLTVGAPEQGRPAAAEAPGEAHHPVAGVVDLPREAPPAGREQPRAPGLGSGTKLFDF